jgi:hypothetical protein
MDTGRSFRSRAVGLLAAASIAVTAACSANATPQKSAPSTVSVPSVSPPVDHAYWQYLWTRIPGSAARHCVRVSNHTDVRSHSFIVGNFRSYISGWDGTIENSKLYYIPLYPEQTAPPLAISAVPLDGQPPDPPIVWRGSEGYWGKAPFYATGTLLVHRGRWRLVATAGRNWGCFDVTL